MNQQSLGQRFRGPCHGRAMAISGPSSFAVTLRPIIAHTSSRSYINNTKSVSYTPSLPGGHQQRRYGWGRTPSTRAPTKVRIQAVAHPAPTVMTGDFPGKGLLKVLSGGSLEETFMSLSMDQACREAVLIVACVVCISLFGQKMVRMVDHQLRSFSHILFKSQDSSSTASIDEEIQREARARRNVFVALVDAVSKPVEALIPLYGSLLTMNVGLTMAKVYLSQRVHQNHNEIMSFWPSCVCAAKNILSKLIELVSESTELVVVVFVAWTLLRVKDKVIRAVGDIVKSTKSFGQDSEISRFLQPLSSLLTWAIVLSTMLSCLLVLGIDVGPMLAVGSVSTIAIGFAAQSTVGNLVAALSLYTSGTFIAGDRVQFKSMGGSTVVSGTVMDIRPMKTLVKCDNGSLVYVNNKDLATSLMVVNESEQGPRSKLSSSIPVIEEEIIVQYKDVDKVEEIVKEIDEYLKMNPDLDSHLTRRCCVVGFCVDGVRVLIKGTLAVQARSRRGQVYTDVFLTSERIVRKHGAFLSQTIGYELPPSLS